MLQYELGFNYGKKGANKDAYPTLKAIAPDMQAFSDSTYFPVLYKYDNKNYQVVFSNFAYTGAEYYTGMGEICTNLSKYDEAVTYLQQAIVFPYQSPWLQYIASNKIWLIKSKKKQYDMEYLNYSLTGMQHCYRLDTSYVSTIKKNNYTNSADYADTIGLLLNKVKGIPDQSAIYARTAGYLDTAGYNTMAADFYRNAYVLDPTNKALLREIISFAQRSNNSSLKKEMETALDKAGANEPDKVIRNLAKTLQQVMASATDPKKHFDDLRGKKFNVPHYGGKPSHSNVELDGALNTFIDDFLKNDRHNYYYWKSFIDEEPKSNLQGRLKERYDAICRELRSLYPQVPVTFMYNDPHYFKMQLTPSVTLEFNYYYNEGYKDMLLLSVCVEKGK